MALVIEYHYHDGDMGSHAVAEHDDLQKVWSDANPQGNDLTHVVLRIATREEVQHGLDDRSSADRVIRLNEIINQAQAELRRIDPLKSITDDLVGHFFTQNAKTTG